MNLNDMPLYSNPVYDNLYDLITELFKDKTISRDIDDYALSLYNWEIKDMRSINELIAFYGNMLLVEENPDYELKTTLYHERIYLSVDGEYYAGTVSLIKNDYSYKLICDKSGYFDHETIRDYQDSFKDHLRGYIIEVLEQLNRGQL